jgi:antitoxin component YwqK of YwqJK toxin-antitoxin module
MVETQPKTSQDGLVEIYYPNTKQLYVREFRKNGKLEGERMMYHENGTLLALSHYKNGKEDGEFVEYFNSGKIWEKSVVCNHFFIGKMYGYSSIPVWWFYR